MHTIRSFFQRKNSIFFLAVSSEFWAGQRWVSALAGKEVLAADRRFPAFF
jgi:hypothetical protein